MTPDPTPPLPDTNAGQPPCRACGADGLTPAFRAGEGDLLLGCPRCHSLTLVTDADYEARLVRHAAGVYHGEGRRRFAATIETAVGRFRQGRARWLMRHVNSGGRVLDIGCGRGLMLAHLARRGYRVAATEIGEEAAVQARTIPGIDLRVGDTALSSFPEASFDAVTSFHTLEHMVDPVATLVATRRLLAPGGQLFLEVPLLSQTARAFGPAWFHLDPPRHLVHFSREGLERAAATAGLAMVERHTFSLEFSAPSLFLSLANHLAPESRLFERAQCAATGAPQRAAATVAILAGSLLCLPPAVVLAAIGEGDVVRARLVAA